MRERTKQQRLKAARARLIEQSERDRATLAAIMASLSDGLLVLDPARRVRFANSRAGAILGVEPPRLLGKSQEEALGLLGSARADPAAVQAACGQALARLEERPRFELAIAGPPQRDVQVEFFPVVDLADDGRSVGIVLRDVTAERNRARTKDELLSVVSHELRSPLTSVLGFAELLLTRQFPQGQTQSYLATIHHEAQRLTHLVNDFLDIERIEAGRLTLHQQPLDLVAVAREVCQALVVQAPGHRLVVVAPPSLPAAFADENRVCQILTNLVSNAIKYSPAGGTVTVSFHAEEGAIRTAIRDEGLGIPAEAVDRVFDKFYRVDSGDRRAIVGSGLGLAICQELVERQGGRIWVESVLGGGSTFFFTLPLAGTAVPAGKS